MINKINLSLYKSLLYCDFFFIKDSFCRFQNSANLFLPKFTAYRLFNVWELLKNLKRFFFIVKFVFFKQFNKMIINIDNFFNYELINFFFKLYPLKNLTLLLSITKTLHLTTPVLGLSSGTPSFFYCLIGQKLELLSKYCHKLINEDVILASLLTLTKNNSQIGFYNIQANFNDFKKFLFLILFLNKIVKHYS